MLRTPNIFINNITHILSNDFDFNIKFDTIRGVYINKNFLDIFFYNSLIGKISPIKNGLKINYYNENNNILTNSNISKFKLVHCEDKKILSNDNLIELHKMNICKYITRIEIIFTNDDNNVIIFNSKVPQNSIFSEDINGKVKNGIALPLDEGSIKLINKFEIFYK